MVISKLITNAYIPAEYIPTLGVAIDLETRPAAAVLRVVRARGDWIHLCLSGGHVKNFHKMPGDVMVDFNENETPLYLTPMGEATLRAALALQPDPKHMILYFLECDVPNARLREKVLATIERVPATWLLVVVGDIAGRCDGRILPHLNISGSVEVNRR